MPLDTSIFRLPSAADVRRVLLGTGKLIGAFAVGAVGTVVGTLVAFKALPLAVLGGEGWKVASAMAARHIGGAVNYVSVSAALDIDPAVSTAGLAADNLIVALYFMSLVSDFAPTVALCFMSPVSDTPRWCRMAAV